MVSRGGLVVHNVHQDQGNGETDEQINSSAGSSIFPATAAEQNMSK